jgi:hypothetical protein
MSSYGRSGRRAIFFGGGTCPRTEPCDNPAETHPERCVMSCVVVWSPAEKKPLKFLDGNTDIQLNMVEKKANLSKEWDAKLPAL